MVGETQKAGLMGNLIDVTALSWDARFPSKDHGGGAEMLLEAQKGTFLVGQWLRLRAPSAGDLGSVPDQGT